MNKTGDLKGEDLRGVRVLVVEDDGMLSMLVQDLLAEIGCDVVASAARYADAERKCATLEFDVVLLDVNLRGERTYPIAEALRARGRPFVLATGYAATAMPEPLRAAPLLQKPYRRQDLGTALWDALHNG